MDKVKYFLGILNIVLFIGMRKYFLQNTSLLKYITVLLMNVIIK